LFAARLLEAEPTSPLRFAGGEIEITVQSRLLAPNTADSYALLAPQLEALGNRLYPGATVAVERVSSDARDPAGARLRAGAAHEIATLLSRLE
jgi:hypothetical protein